MRFHLSFHPVLRALALTFLLASFVPSALPAEQAPQVPSGKPSRKPSAAPEKEENPAQIELLETRYRFETNGDSRKEVHTRVHLNNELGVREFARLNFDYNRSFQSIEIPLVHISHPGGGTADILPSAVTDNPNPAVINFPAYQDVRVKSVRILGLAPGDTLEYRIITTTTHHPLAPDFWLEHSFDRSGVVSHELFEVDLPASPKPDLQFNPTVPPPSIDESGEGHSGRRTYHWEMSGASAAAPRVSGSKDSAEAEPDVALSTTDWFTLAVHLDGNLTPGAKRLEGLPSDEFEEELSRRYRNIDPEVSAKAADLTKATHTTRATAEVLYNFVSQKIATVDLPVDATGFAARPANEILASGYATQEDKFVLLAALAAAAKLSAEASLTGYCDSKGTPRPTIFNHLLIRLGDAKGWLSWLDPSLEVAPFGVVPANSGKCVFVLDRGFVSLSSTGHEWQKLETDPPFPSTQSVSINAVLGSDGSLKSKVRYSMRGQNELLLRLAFHKSAKEKWKDLAQLLSISDGFRGQVTDVTVSDPYATKDPFTVEYKLTQLKFVDWAKVPVRIPALLPQLGLPDPPAKPAPGAALTPIELGTPLDVETHMFLHLPPGTTVSAPTGTSVQRDYATFVSQYSAKGLTVTASRHINFLLRQVTADRAADYHAFLRAVQNDQAQDFTLDRAVPPASRPGSSTGTPPPVSKP